MFANREATPDAAPPPLPHKLTNNNNNNNNNDVVSAAPNAPIPLGSLWNKAGTWEEKNLTKWATDRLKELLGSVGSLQFSSGKAGIVDVNRCVGDAFLVTVRNKKKELAILTSFPSKSKVRETLHWLHHCVDRMYLHLSFIVGEWSFEEDTKKVKGSLDIAEFSFGELDDLEVDVKLSDDKELSQQLKQQIRMDMKQFLEPVRLKLGQFEQELKDR
ncbi:chaperone binding [Raphanus sativus]|nr:chaperone binding [Raphanus sativus]